MGAPHNQQTGQQGETIAADYLKSQGYTILQRNWRYSRAEVDLIAQHADTIVFVEVKTRSYKQIALPEHAVSKAKQRQLRRAAEAFIETQSGMPEVRFDIISIVLQNPKPEVEHFVDAFYPFETY